LGAPHVGGTHHSSSNALYGNVMASQHLRKTRMLSIEVLDLLLFNGKIAERLILQGLQPLDLKSS